MNRIGTPHRTGSRRGASPEPHPLIIGPLLFLLGWAALIVFAS